MDSAFKVVHLEDMPQAINILLQRMSDFETRFSRLFPTESIQRDTVQNSAGELLTRTEVKKRLKVSYPTLRDWTISGKIPSVQIGTTIRYNWADVQAAFTKIKPAAI